MEAKIDLHVHSIASGHYTTDTVTTLAKQASKLKLSALAITDHAPKMPGTTSESYFLNLPYCDKKLFGVEMLYGVELNILNSNGEVDLKPEILKRLDFSIASLHKDVFRHVSEKDDTLAVISAMKNPYVNVIGHPDSPDFSLNVHAITDGAKEYGVALELNSVGTDEHGYRKQNTDWLKEMLVLCKKKGVYVTLGSDSHGKEKIADFKNSFNLLSEIDFPEELVLNTSIEKFRNFVLKKRK